MAEMREVFMYACHHCGTLKVFESEFIEGTTMHCSACHHVAIPDPIAISFKAHKFVTPAGPRG